MQVTIYLFPLLVTGNNPTMSILIRSHGSPMVLENTPVEANLSRDQEDWFNSLEEELTQVQEDLNFYDNILGEFTAEDSISLGLASRGDTTQESSAVMTTA